MKLFAVLGFGEIVMLTAAALMTITLLVYLNKALEHGHVHPASAQLARDQQPDDPAADDDRVSHRARLPELDDPARYFAGVQRPERLVDLVEREAA